MKSYLDAFEKALSVLNRILVFIIVVSLGISLAKKQGYSENTYFAARIKD